MHIVCRILDVYSAMMKIFLEIFWDNSEIAFFLNHSYHVQVFSILFIFGELVNETSYHIAVWVKFDCTKVNDWFKGRIFLLICSTPPPPFQKKIRQMEISFKHWCDILNFLFQAPRNTVCFGPVQRIILHSGNIVCCKLLSFF